MSPTILSQLEGTCKGKKSSRKLFGVGSLFLRQAFGRGTMASYACNCHHGWRTQAAWTKNIFETIGYHLRPASGEEWVHGYAMKGN